MGDVSQYDIKRNDVKLTDFVDKILKGVKNTASFQFTKEDIVRNPILIQIVDKYEKYKELCSTKAAEYQKKLAEAEMNNVNSEEV